MGEKTKKKKNKRWKIEAANKMLLPLIAVASCSVETPFGSPIRTSHIADAKSTRLGYFETPFKWQTQADTIVAFTIF